jgi:hypothetical protein
MLLSRQSTASGKVGPVCYGFVSVTFSLLGGRTAPESDVRYSGVVNMRLEWSSAAEHEARDRKCGCCWVFETMPIVMLRSLDWQIVSRLRVSGICCSWVQGKLIQGSRLQSLWKSPMVVVMPRVDSVSETSRKLRMPRVDSVSETSRKLRGQGVTGIQDHDQGGVLCLLALQGLAGSVQLGCTGVGTARG